MRTLIAAAFVFLFAGGVSRGAVAEEVAAEKSSEVLPPVPQADKRDIFRAYESALLRPAERCWEWELTDPSVRRVVSDAAEHFGSMRGLRERRNPTNRLVARIDVDTGVTIREALGGGQTFGGGLGGPL